MEILGFTNTIVSIPVNPQNIGRCHKYQCIDLKKLANSILPINLSLNIDSNGEKCALSFSLQQLTIL